MQFDQWVTSAIAVAVVAVPAALAVAKWRGSVEERLKQSERDREILHERIGAKEEAIEAQLKELTAAVNGLSKQVAVLMDREERK